VIASPCRSLDFSQLRMDLYLMPPSLEWTMVFTHEQPGIGPFFSMAQWAQP
jgi:hypothetical protein